MDLVSIIIPVYNMEKQLSKSVNSILLQSYKNFELLLIDDGSSDNSYYECEKLKLKDNRIRVFHKENEGAGPARNYGILQATGKYAYFPDADDSLNNDALSILVDTAQKNKSDLVVFGYNCINSKGKEVARREYKKNTFSGEDVRSDYSKFYASEDGYRIQGAPWNKFFSLELIKKYNIEFPDMRRHQDEAFIARYVSQISSVIFIQDVLYTYFLNDLKREWEKYPINYLDSVEKLFKERKTNILIWNRDDVETHNMVYLEYIYYMIKVLELSFAPKFNFNHRQRIAWMKKVIDDSEFLIVYCPKEIHFYQKVVRKCILGNEWKIAYCLIWFKIHIQKYVNRNNT